MLMWASSGSRQTAHLLDAALDGDVGILLVTGSALRPRRPAGRGHDFGETNGSYLPLMLLDEGLEWLVHVLHRWVEDGHLRDLLMARHCGG